MQEGKRRAVSPTPNLHLCAEVLSYIASYLQSIANPAIRTMQKFSQSPKRFLFLDMPSTNNSIAGLKSTISRLSVLDQASHSTHKSYTNEPSQDMKPLNHLVQQAKLSLLSYKILSLVCLLRASIFC